MCHDVEIFFRNHQKRVPESILRGAQSWAATAVAPTMVKFHFTCSKLREQPLLLKVY